MNTEKDSLKENLDEILANLPAQFHEDLKKQVAELPDTAPAAPTSEEQVAAIKAALKENPAVDESAAAAELGDIKAPELPAQPSEAEVEAEMAKALAEMKKSE